MVCSNIQQNIEPFKNSINVIKYKILIIENETDFNNICIGE